MPTVGCQRWSVSGLPDGMFQTKSPNLGEFWRALEWTKLVFSRAIWTIYYGLLVYFKAISPRFGILNKEKSGNLG
jgi:hypothetical protein